jgi:PhnB protein
MKINTYLFFDGTCAEAFRLYERVLGGKIDFIQTFGDAPAGAAPSAPELRDWIMHVHLVVGDQVLMGSDAPPPHFQQPQGFSVSLALEDPAEAERIFNELSAGGTVGMPLQKTFWAHRFGMFTDRYAIPWMVSCDKGD